MSIATQTNPKSSRPLKPQVPDFCPACDAVDHPFKLKLRKVTQEFRGEMLELEAPAMRCGHCGFEIAAPGQLDALRLATTQAYRLRHKLLASEEIIERRKIMGMSQKAFADHVGVGVASLQRWENGLVVQDKASDELLKERTKHTQFVSPKGGQTGCRSGKVKAYVSFQFSQPATWMPQRASRMAHSARKVNNPQPPSRTYALATTA